MYKSSCPIKNGLTLNEAQDHHDPSDHVIIAHAITENLTLLFSD